MTLEEIRASGILEQYVLQLLSEEESQRVEAYMQEFPELTQDYLEIQHALQSFAQAKGIAPRKGLEEEIISSIKSDKIVPPKQKPDNSNPFRLLSILLGVALIGFLFYIMRIQNQLTGVQQQLIDLQASCDSISAINTARFALLENLRQPDNQPLRMTPTDNYPETQLVFHTNPGTQQNFIQIINLPQIGNNQSFQLWSLKEGENPIPLTVFTGQDDPIVPVDFEDGTATYAITIEPAGGSQVPTLTQLIGTVGV